MPAAAVGTAISAASAINQHNQAKKAQKNVENFAKDISYTPLQWTPYAGGDLQYSTSPELASSMANIKNMASNVPAGNQYLTNAGNETNRILGSDYQAYSNDALTRQYENAKKNLEKDFGKQENQVASRMANSGLTGSGISTANWGDQATSEKNILANIWQQLQSTNEQATQANKQNALRMAPKLAQLSAQLSQQPLENQLRYNTILQQQNAAKNAVDSYNNQRKWDEWVQQMNLNRSNNAGQNQANNSRYEALMNYYTNLANANAQSSGSAMNAMGTALSLMNTYNRNNKSVKAKTTT
jgi:hypothetical protein